MGSVGDSYLCPWCGRVGFGGYAMDGINYPICDWQGAGWNYSCMSFQVEERGLGLEGFRVLQLQTIFQRRCAWSYIFENVLAWELIARFLGPLQRRCAWSYIS